MTEKEYRVSIFNDKFEKFKKKNIVLYGTAANSKAIVEAYDDTYNILGLMSETAVGCYYFGKRVLSENEVIELQTDVIIIAAQISSAEAVYNRILKFCMNNHILLYDMYGNNAVELHREVTGQKISYMTRGMEHCKKEIDKYDVISFDMMDTFVMRKVPSIHEIFDLVSSQIPDEIIIDDYKFSRCKAEAMGRCFSLDAVYANVQKLTNLSSIYVDEIKKLEIELEIENSFVRKQMKEIYDYAKERGKEIIFVSDWLIPKQVQEDILKNAGVTDYDGFFWIGDDCLTKVDGLFRSVLEKYGDQRVLHIGDDDIDDWIAPKMYGFNSYVLLSPFETLQKSNCRVNKVQIEFLNHKWLLGSLLAEAFEDPFVLYGTNGIVDLSEKQKQMSAEIHAVMNDAQIEFKPVLLESPGNKERIEGYEKLVFTDYENPRVSIVIPVYNQFEYTYLCLKSILKYSGEVEYEVIVADDCSTDYVKELEKIVEGATIIHNEENLRFLLNCNNAAKKAKGQYILFLNNDTQVQPGWLKPLVDLIEKDDTIGMVGSKLVYPNGYLQEAGGILWKDASAWNYGRNQDPDKAEFNYIKDVDYISGASIMIRADLWKEIGGFDERFVPAYYEDSDLAFEVRKHGKRVVYQPLSVVVHFEGVSNGKDEKSGIKACQIVNNKKFYEKWKTVLEDGHFENGTNVLSARDRSKDKKHILVIDHYVPTYDRDAGSKTSFMYLKLFVKMGMQVTFIGDNFNKMEPYGTELNQLGIEILYGRYYFEHWEDWVMLNLKYYDYVYMQRPDVSTKYVDIFKKYGHAKILYYDEDLHHLREYRQYQIEKRPELLESAQKHKKMEFELFEKVDVVHVPSNEEKEIIQKELPYKTVRRIPCYLYDEPIQNINKDFSQRRDLLFVGGFGHTPNIDGVLWFAREVFPLIIEKYPDILWHVVGNNPPEEIVALASESIIIEGFLPDEELAERYADCRMAVAPLRFGAGVKGKIVEAMQYQVPIVTTTIGAEGLNMGNGIFEIEDDPVRMAQKICNLYEDYDRLRKMSDLCVKFIDDYFTSEAAIKVLGQDIVW